MSVAAWVSDAQRRGASDLHLEPGLPRALRIDGVLHRVGEPVSGAQVQAAARELIGPEWPRFLEQRSYDLSRRLGGVQCRINVLHSYRGVGMAIRLLSGFQPTLAKLNLLPDLAELVTARHGLVLVVGTTGSGKSSTLAALVHALDSAGPARHVVTLEEPIEYLLRTRNAFVRQREVGRHTPSFEQGLLDAMREDPDVILVGEMRRPQTMQLTLDAAETGHLVLASMHAGSASEAIQRVVASFPPETQGAVRAQLAGSLVGVVAQRLTARPGLDFRVPECQILRASTATRAVIREGHLHKLGSIIDLGAQDGQWSWDRYRRWQDNRTRWTKPRSEKAPPPIPSAPVAAAPSRARPAPGKAGVVELDEGGDLEDLIAQLKER